MQLTSKDIRRTVGRAAILAASHSRLWPKLGAAFPNSLSVLLYHRIADPEAPGFFGFVDNVSATPAGFTAQMDYLKANYNVVSLDQVIEWAQGACKLPPRAVLVTFDDGYDDNYSVAAPLLQERGLPAVIFVATAFMNETSIFFWDAVADAAQKTPHSSATLPLIGDCQLAGQDDRQNAVRNWVAAAITLPERDRTSSLIALSQALGVKILDRPPRKHHMTWKDARALAAHGIAVAPHSATHPVFAQLSPDQAEQEIVTSKQAVFENVGPCQAFSFPYGRPVDFTGRDAQLLAQHGFSVAFRSNGGLALSRDAKQTPYALRRTNITNDISFNMFQALVAGATRLITK